MSWNVYFTRITWFTSKGKDLQHCEPLGPQSKLSMRYDREYPGEWRKSSLVVEMLDIFVQTHWPVKTCGFDYTQILFFCLAPSHTQLFSYQVLPPYLLTYRHSSRHPPSSSPSQSLPLPCSSPTQPLHSSSLSEIMVFRFLAFVPTFFKIIETVSWKSSIKTMAITV